MVSQIQVKASDSAHMIEWIPTLTVPSTSIGTLTSTSSTWEVDLEAYGWWARRSDASVAAWPIEGTPNVSKMSNKSGNSLMALDGLWIHCCKRNVKKISQVRGNVIVFTRHTRAHVTFWSLLKKADDPFLILVYSRVSNDRTVSIKCT